MPAPATVETESERGGSKDDEYDDDDEQSFHASLFSISRVGSSATTDLSAPES